MMPRQYIPWLILGALALVVLAGPLFGGIGPGGHGWHGYPPAAFPPGATYPPAAAYPAAAGWWPGAALAGLVRLAVLGALIALALKFFRRGGPGASQQGHPEGETSAETAQEILRQRYAAGEITREQFDEMRQTLGRT